VLRGQRDEGAVRLPVELDEHQVPDLKDIGVVCSTSAVQDLVWLVSLGLSALCWVVEGAHARHVLLCQSTQRDASLGGGGALKRHALQAISMDNKGPHIDAFEADSTHPC
jgi:hypothetical protein